MPLWILDIFGWMWSHKLITFLLAVILLITGTLAVQYYLKLQAESERDATKESLQKANDKAEGLQIIINSAPQAAEIQKQKEVANAQSINTNQARANLQQLSNVNWKGINGKDLDRMGKQYDK